MYIVVLYTCKEKGTSNKPKGRKESEVTEMAKKIAFINGKGGCGKTTSIFHVSGVLSKRGEKVLVIDLDKQRNTTDTLLMNNENRPEKTVLDFFKGEAEASEATAQALLQDETELSVIDGKSVGERLEAFIEEQGYTWVLVDMPPSNLTLNNICFGYLVDYALIPFSSDIFSVQGYGDIMDVMAKAREVNPTLNVLGVYLARYMTQCAVDKYIRDELLGFETFIDVQIPLASDVREAVMFGRPISYYKTISKSRKAYENLVEEIENRMNA